MLEELADVLSGAVGASRAAVDAGWVDHSIQVGQTVKQLCLNYTSRAAFQAPFSTLSEMNASDKIIAINKDPKAPIFSIADIGIVGDVYEIVPELIKTLKG